MDVLGRKSARGIDNGSAKLSDDEVREIRSLLDDGISHGKIAAIYGVARSQISNIANGKTWTHVT